MRLIALAKAERRCEVAAEVIHLLDVCQKGLVDGLLVRYTAARHLLLLYSTSAKILTYWPIGGFHHPYLCFLSLLEESLLGSFLLGLLTDEVLGCRDLVDLGLGNASQVDLERSGDDVS